MSQRIDIEQSATRTAVPVLAIIATVALSLALLPSAPASAQESPAAGIASSGPTRARLGLVGTVGRAVELNGSVDVDDRTIFIRYTRVLGDGGLFLGGEPSWGVEVGAFFFDQEPAAKGFGAHLVYEHRFVPGAAVHPILHLGAGALLTDERVPPGETRHNFSLLAGLGLEARLTRGLALQAGYRLHHVSNADTGLRNPGINAHTLVTALVFDL